MPELTRVNAGTLTPVERDSVITFGGQLGIFTPITHGAGAPPDPNADKNIEVILEAYRKEIAGLKADNESLQSKLTALESKAGSADDFAGALQHSLDQLQAQLSSMTNPVTNFAVKEFRIETKVRVAVTPLGAVEYRFVDATEAIDADRLSTITLQLVPVPKQTTMGTFIPGLFEPNRPVSAIEGLTVAQQSELHANHIDTVSDFLAAGTRARAQVELAALLKVDREQLAAWVSTAELLTLKGVDGGRAAVLLAAGVKSLHVLAALKPDELVKQFNEARTKLKREDVPPLDAAEATLLIKAAADFVGLPRS